MIIGEARLLPANRWLSFMLTFWAFIFSWAAVAFAGLFWLGVTPPTGWLAESYGALALISVFTGTIAVCTAVALPWSQLFPAPQPSVSADSTSVIPLVSDFAGR